MYFTFQHFLVGLATSVLQGHMRLAAVGLNSVSSDPGVFSQAEFKSNTLPVLHVGFLFCPLCLQSYQLLGNN